MLIWNGQICTSHRQRPHTKQQTLALIALVLTTLFSSEATGQDGGWIVGVRLRLGWKYDNVRMCGATGPGVPHGPDIDLSAFGEASLSDRVSLDVNLPLFRPIMFAAAASMLQLEPELTLLFRGDAMGATRFVAGPSLGASLNYGPDLNSTANGIDRGPAFWAVGPRIGGYAGLDFTRPGESFNVQLGLHPYVTPLASINDPEKHRGWIAGATLDSSFRFHSEP